MNPDICRDTLVNLVKDEGDPRFELAPLSREPEGLPVEWRGILGGESPTRQVLESLWRRAADLLPETLTELEKHVRAVGLLCTDRIPFSLIYVFETKKQQPAFRRGFPCRPIEAETAGKFPKNFLDLYRVHDGWTDINGFMGPLSRKEWFDLSYILDEDESEAIPGLRPEDFLVTCNSGGSELLGFDMSKTPPRGLVYSPIEPVTLAPDVVQTLDEWMANDLRYLA